MAVTSIEVPFRADVGRWSRWHPRLPRWALPVAMALVLIGVLATAAMRIDYAANYQPLMFEGGGTVGPASAGLKPVNDGFEVTRWLLTAKPGTMATLAYTLANTGSDPVTVYDIPESPKYWIYTTYAWAPAMDFSGAHKQLPVVIAPHQAIELLFSIRQPPCKADSGREEINALVVNYRAFGFSHTMVAPFGAIGFEPIEVCWDQH